MWHSNNTNTIYPGDGVCSVFLLSASVYDFTFHHEQTVVGVLTFLTVREKYLVRMSCCLPSLYSFNQLLARLFQARNRCGVNFFMKLAANM
jgi:hypothetical protein